MIFTRVYTYKVLGFGFFTTINGWTNQKPSQQQLKALF